MKAMLVSRFREISQSPIELSELDVAKVKTKQRANPFVFPHADIARHYDNFYVVSSKGLQVSEYTLETRVKKVWDAPSFSLDINQRYIAVAAGDEGLFEHSISGLNNGRSEPTHMRETHSSNFVRWVYPSLYGSSYGGGHLYDYAIQKVMDEGQQDEKPKKERVFLNTIPDEQLYQHVFHRPSPSGYSWGVRDRICFASDSRIRVVKYVPNTPSKSKNALNFSLLASSTCEHNWSDVIGADSSHFGYIVELEDGLWILKSNNEWFWLQGEPVNWRIFPNTLDYLNQLHVIYDDYLSVFAFTHDYFEQQHKKKFGISFTRSKRRS